MATDDIILGVLSLYPASGYDIKTEFEQGGAGLLSALNFGSIYPRLRQLEQAGLIMTTDANVGGRSRRLHDLTAAGWRQLADWLTAPTDYPIPLRDELLLKMIFWGAGRPGNRAALIEHLDARRDQTRALLAHLDAWPANGHSLVDEYAMLVFDYFRLRLTAELDWIERAITQLEGPPHPPIQDPRNLTAQQRERRIRALHEAASAEPSNPAESASDPPHRP